MAARGRYVFDPGATAIRSNRTSRVVTAVPSAISVRSRRRAWNIRVFTVLTGHRMIVAISAQDRPSK